MIAVVPVRAGTLPAGGPQAAAEAGGRVLVVGDGVASAAAGLAGATEVLVAEAGPFAPARWARQLAGALAGEDVVVLPASPDGRDLAPHLAAALGRPLLANAVAVDDRRAVLASHGGRVAHEVPVDRPVVVTLEPAARDAGRPAPEPAVPRPVELADPGAVVDARSVELLPPDPASMDLAEAPRIVAGGAGLGDGSAFTRLGSVATALGASLGATRVVTDAGLVGHERQIGTTGVTVAPRLYLAFGISGAVQHTGGLGHPDHVVAVNTDPSCPMMAMADLAIVADAPAVVAALADRLGVATGPEPGGG